ESNHKLAAKFGEIGVRLWHKRCQLHNENVQELMKSMEEKILNGKVVVTAKDPKDLWDSGLAMWICYDCNISIQQDDKPDECPNCKNKDLHKRI
ncbi:unnamed protein product, partial [marine sediment metagenome]